MEAPAGRRYRVVTAEADDVFLPGKEVTGLLAFADPLGRRIRFNLDVLAGAGLP